MSFKKLNSGDFSLSVAPIITEIDDPGANATNRAFDSTAATSSGEYRGWAGITNIIGEKQEKADGFILSFARKDFRQSIFPNNFSIGGVFPATGSDDVVITKAGRKFEASDYDLYPDIGIAVTDSDESSSDITMCSEETMTTAYVTIRILPSEFNYSTNPSFAADGGTQVKDPYLLNPITYITTIGLYNDNNELLAVAKTGKPLKKDFVTSYSLNVQLDF